MTNENLRNKFFRKWIRKWMRLATKGLSPKEKLQFLFSIEQDLYLMEGEASIAYDKGKHTKHRHMNYHDFFIKNLKPHEHVLDIGSGNGFLSYDMVTKVENTKVVGLEASEVNYRQACEQYIHPNLSFVKGDAIKNLPEESFDVVTMSNVLEHIEDRNHFLKTILLKAKPKRIILRVPLFERDWRVPLKKEVGADYRLDRTHFIEYSQEEFLDEMKRAELQITHMEVKWGEIWSVVEPIVSHVRN